MLLCMQLDLGLNLDGLLEDARLAPTVLTALPSTAAEATLQLLALPPAEAAANGRTLLMQVVLYSNPTKL